MGTGYAFSTLWAMRSRFGNLSILSIMGEDFVNVFFINRNQALQKAEEDEFKYLVHEIRANNAARAPHAHKHHADIFNKIFVASFMLMIIPILLLFFFFSLSSNFHQAFSFSLICFSRYLFDSLLPPSSSAGEIDWDKPETIEAAIESLNNQK